MGVAFLDVGVYVTSLRCLKNLLLVGDAAKSVWFVAFQEDPFKLVRVSKDVWPLCVAYTDFLFSSAGQFYIAVGDEEGIVRLLEFDPSGRTGSSASCRSLMLIHTQTLNPMRGSICFTEQSSTGRSNVARRL